MPALVLEKCEQQKLIPNGYRSFDEHRSCLMFLFRGEK